MAKRIALIVVGIAFVAAGIAFAVDGDVVDGLMIALPVGLALLYGGTGRRLTERQEMILGGAGAAVVGLGLILSPSGSRYPEAVVVVVGALTIVLGLVAVVVGVLDRES